MTVFRFNKIDWGVVEKQYPVLATTLDELNMFNKAQKEAVAGLVVDVVLQSGGTTTLLTDEDEIYFDEELD